MKYYHVDNPNKTMWSKQFKSKVVGCNDPPNGIMHAVGHIVISDFDEKSPENAMVVVKQSNSGFQIHTKYLFKNTTISPEYEIRKKNWNKYDGPWIWYHSPLFFIKEEGPRHHTLMVDIIFELEKYGIKFDINNSYTIPLIFTQGKVFVECEGSFNNLTQIQL